MDFLFWKNNKCHGLAEKWAKAIYFTDSVSENEDIESSVEEKGKVKSNNISFEGETNNKSFEGETNNKFFEGETNNKSFEGETNNKSFEGETNNKVTELKFLILV